MADTSGFTYKHAGLEGSLKTDLVIEELDDERHVVRRWAIGSFSTMQQALAARQIIADSLGRQVLGPPLTEADVDVYKSSL